MSGTSFNPSMAPDVTELWLINCTREEFVAYVKKCHIKHQFVVE